MRLLTPPPTGTANLLRLSGLQAGLPLRVAATAFLESALYHARRGQHRHANVRMMAAQTLATLSTRF